jgi:DNA-directed RNA polymerase alpha subunit
MANCGDCKWWVRAFQGMDKREKSKIQGNCRRYPQDVERYCTYWCGEYQSKLLRENQSIDKLCLSIRAKKRLYNRNIVTIDQLMGMDLKELLKIPGFGKTSYRELKIKLAKLVAELNDSSS